MDEVKTYIINECRHCGNKTKLDIKASYIVEYRETICCDLNWVILNCCACSKISFGLIYSGEDTIVYHQDNSIEYEELFETLFPLNTYQQTNVPKSVHQSFEAALKARYLDGSICLIALRRTLEIICKEQGEVEGNLVKKIQNLSLKGILPSILNDASDILRIMGNEAAHGDSIDYSQDVITEMINFTQIIIEYVYALPHRIEKIKIDITSDKKLKI